MAKKGKKVQVELVGGRFRKGSTIGNLLEALEDKRSHRLASLKGEVGKGAHLLSRLKAIRSIGRQMKSWDLELDDTQVRLIAFKPGSAGKRSSNSKSSPATRKAHKGAKSAPAARARAKVQDVPVDEGE